MTAGINIDDLEKRKIAQKKRDGCKYYVRRFGACSIKSGLYWKSVV